jgi:hypothetical protein
MYYRFKGEAKRKAGQQTRVAAKVSNIPTSTLVTSIVDTVATAKALIDKLGKEDAKRLIDLL